MENISEYAEIEGFSDESVIPDIDTEGIVNDILGIENE